MPATPSPFQSPATGTPPGVAEGEVAPDRRGSRRRRTGPEARNHVDAAHDAEVGDAVAVPVAGHGDVAGLTEASPRGRRRLGRTTWFHSCQRPSAKMPGVWAPSPSQSPSTRLAPDGQGREPVVDEVSARDPGLERGAVDVRRDARRRRRRPAAGGASEPAAVEPTDMGSSTHATAAARPAVALRRAIPAPLRIEPPPRRPPETIGTGGTSTGHRRRDPASGAGRRRSRADPRRRVTAMSRS